MKKTKLDTRIENALNAFFENTEQFENSQMVLNNNCSAIWREDRPPAEAAEKIDSIISLGKLVFLFLPAAFFLYKLTLTFVYVTFQSICIRSDLGGYDYHFLMFFIQNYLLGPFFLLIGIFMTYIGVGNLRETKNLVVPGSITSFSLLLSVLFSFLPLELRGQIVMYYSIYLFPLVLVVAGLARHWVNKNEENNHQ